MAEALGAALIKFVIGATVSAGVATAVGTAVIGVGFGVLNRVLAPKPGRREFGSFAAALTRPQQQSDAARILCYGVRLLAGYETYRNDRTPWVDQVFTLTGHEISEYLETWIDNGNGPEFLELEDSGGGVFIPVTGSPYRDHIKIQFKLGAAGEEAFSELVSVTGGDDPAPPEGSWTPSDRQDGCASVYVATEYRALDDDDQPLFRNGIPSLAWVIRGKPVWDPRADDGAGAMVSDDRCRNPVLCTRDYLTMPKIMGFPAIPAEDIPDEVTIAQANICDQEVDLVGGGTQKRYLLDWVGEMRGDWARDLEEMFDAMAGWPVFGATYEIYAGAWTGSVLTITDADLRGPIQNLQTLKSARDEYGNITKGTFVSPEANWQPTDYAPQRDSNAITRDGEPLIHELTLTGTTDKFMAARIAHIKNKSLQQQVAFTLPCKTMAYEVKAGEIITFPHQRFVDAEIWPETKTFKVLRTKNVQQEGEPEEGGGEAEEPVPIAGVDLEVMEWSEDIYLADGSTPDSGGDSISRPTANTAIEGDGYQFSPQAAYDGLPSTFGNGAVGSLVGVDFKEHEWSGWTALGGEGAIALRIESYLAWGNFLTPGTAILRYSLNNGSSWIEIYNGNPPMGEDPTRRIDIVTLPEDQDMSQLLVRQSVDVTGVGTSGSHGVWEMYAHRA